MYLVWLTGLRVPNLPTYRESNPWIINPQICYKLIKYQRCVSHLMLDKMKVGTTIILDDARRENEQKTLKLWEKEYSSFEFNYLDDNDKGIAIIKKIK